MNLWDVLPQISMSGLYLKEGGFICTNNFMLVLKILDTHKTEMNISISVCNVCCCTIIALPHALQQCWLRFFNIHITLMESIRSNWKCHWPLSQIASYSGVTLLYAVHWFVCDSIKLSLPGYLRVGFDCAHFALYALLPVTGWVGESWLRRYQPIVVGLIIIYN